MGTGYTRNDTANNIADGNVINASDLDGEFDAIQAAFNATTGHSHDGTTGEGPQIGTGGIADTAVTTAKIADLNVTTGKIANDAVTLGTKTSGNYVATAGVSGVGLSGSASAEGATFTVTSNATDANTASTIVARDASGNFSAGTITAALTGTASNAALLDSLDSTQFLRSDAADTKTSGDLSFSDGVKAIFGAGSDFEIVHTGTNTNLRENGTGNLNVWGDDIYFYNSAGTETKASYLSNGAVTLYYDNAAKLATTSSGIDVTGTVTADRLLSIDTTGTNYSIIENKGAGALKDTLVLRNFSNNSGTGAKLIFAPTINDATIRHSAIAGVQNGSNNIDMRFYTSAGTDPVERMRIKQNGDISFYDSTGTTQGLFWDASTQRLGLGSTSPNKLLEIAAANTGASENNVLRLTDLDTAVVLGQPAGSIEWYTSDGNAVTSKIGAVYAGTGAGSSLVFSTAPSAATGISERLRIDEDGNVGIGTSSPNGKLAVIGSSSANLGSLVQFSISGGQGFYFNSNSSGLLNTLAVGTGENLAFSTGASEAMRIDSSGNLLVGKTSASVANDGIQLEASGTLGVTRANDDVAIFNRKSSDGNIAVFRKDNTTVGTIGTNSSRTYIGSGSGQSGIKFNTGAIVPVAGADGANSDASYSLGISSARFTNAYFSATVFAAGVGGVSDENTYVNFPGSDVMQFYTGGSERARLTSTGQLLVGQTSNQAHLNTATGDGLTITQSGEINQGTTGESMILNRRGSDGNIIRLRKDGTTVGTIGVDSSDNLYLTGQTGNTGGFYMNDAAVSPAYQGAERDAYYDLGKGAARWKDLHLSGQANVGTAVAATQSASVTGSTTLDFSTYQNFILTMTGNITLAQPSTEQAGQSGFIIFIHSGAARTVSLGADYETAGAAGLTLSGASGAVDLVPYVVQSSGNILLGAPQLAFA